MKTTGIIFVLKQECNTHKELTRTCQSVSAQSIDSFCFKIIDAYTPIDLLLATNSGFEWGLIVQCPAYLDFRAAEYVQDFFLLDSSVVAQGYTRQVNTAPPECKVNKDLLPVIAFNPQKLLSLNKPVSSFKDLQNLCKSFAVIPELLSTVHKPWESEDVKQDDFAFNIDFPAERELTDCLQLLSPAILDKHLPLVNDLIKFADFLELRHVGWHYWMDYVWILNHLSCAPGSTILDAGAGTGLIQFALAKMGYHVISVDVYDREPLGKVKYAMQSWPGSINFVKGDLSNLGSFIKDKIDGIVSISALEHNTPEQLHIIINELLSLLKPDAVMSITMNASFHEDWYHVPSKGWNYCKASFINQFNLKDFETNWSNYSTIYNELQRGGRLYELLAPGYYSEEDNGMPWGIWAPCYQPVGICKMNKR